ncbi:MAG: cyclic nucleotide-binding domain-containing protein [Planctomycetaceae bacterium]|nr:cyclic nucleotide-binding domain-containing protein [Planctomycetaceae bacterium]MCP4463280.1 cyclic nucleotide-binding domain-containing protein [Planctomycetaceae bacterium]MDG2105395.1 cyclic nucleotide-binding and patatin-like phospholipase domain-containing protein [Pirellulaceae bacterium]
MEHAHLLLQRHPITEGLTEEQVLELSTICEQITLQTGDILHSAGETVDSIFLLVQGRLKQTTQASNSLDRVNNYMVPGTQFGGVAAVRNEPLEIQVSAVEPSTALKINFQKFHDMTRPHPQLMINFIVLVGDMLKKQLHLDRLLRPPKVVMILHDSEHSRQLTEIIIDRLLQLEEHPCLLTDSKRWQSRSDIEHLLLVEDGVWMEPAEVRHRVAQWSTRDRVLIEATTEGPYERLQRGMAIANKVLVCVHVSNWQETLEKVRQLSKDTPRWREKISLVWILDKENLYPPLISEFKDICSGDFKVSFDAPPEKHGDVWKHGVERIIHALRGVRLGLALGGGAARGMAHLGVLQVLEKHGIVTDMIAGTSAGAMTGTLYASGMELEHTINSFIKDLTPSWIFRNMPGGGYWYLLYKYRFQKFDPMLRNYLHQLQLQQLPVPMNSVTVDLVSGKAKVRSDGDAVRGIVESINLPGLSKPIVNNGEALVDGGLVNNIPADVLVEKGCNFVIAVSVTAKLEQVFGKISPDQTHSRVRTPSTLQTIMRGYLVQSVNMNSVGIEPADVIVTPDVTGFDLTEFTRSDELAAIGAETTENAINEIRKTLTRIDPQLFRSP